MENDIANLIFRGGDTALIIVLMMWGYGKVSTRLTIIETTLKLKHVCHRIEDSDEV